MFNNNNPVYSHCIILCIQNFITFSNLCEICFYYKLIKTMKTVKLVLEKFLKKLSNLRVKIS